MRKAKVFRTRLKLITVVVLAVAALVPLTMHGASARPDSASGALEQPVVDAPSEGCNDLTGKWKTTTEHGSAVWELKKGPGWGETHTAYEAKQIIPGNNGRYMPHELFLAGDGYVAGKGFLAAISKDNRLKLEYDGQKQDTRESYTGIYLCKLDADCQSSVSPCVLHHGIPGRGAPDATFKATIKRQ